MIELIHLVNLIHLIFIYHRSYIAVADLGEGTKLRRRAEKKNLETTPPPLPYLLIWMTAPPPSSSEGLDPLLYCPLQIRVYGSEKKLEARYEKSRLNRKLLPALYLICLRK